MTEATAPSYTLADIVADGCFVPQPDLAAMLERLGTKKNLVLQGPPGTGKTWLAKRLAYALIGDPPERARERVRVVQFHPSYAYEDFVRGYRPKGREGLDLVDGILLEAVQAATAEGDRPFVLVIEEINRGNPAQIFGETLTLLEHDKRERSEAIELAYRRFDGERVYLPPNLYVIGTMNLADRSLALVDLALRRRFAFVTLTPRFDAAWRAWCAREGRLPEAFLDRVATRIAALNAEIADAPSLGEPFAIGHSYLTPGRGRAVADPEAWFQAIVATEIAPLLEEYWYEDPATARAKAEALVRP
ncbi:AAA family ATPase [Salinarimonas soli]|uniref:AAA family ATPase n=1 Tax=Salinarimonas soli TaxID=1638099 RepID=UPI001F0B234B|nr:AAA family ATPase [Salinarimonas soli]